MCMCICVYVLVLCVCVCACLCCVLCLVCARACATGGESMLRCLCCCLSVGWYSLSTYLPCLSLRILGNPSGGRDSLERTLSLFPLQPRPQDVPACLSPSSHSQRGNGFQVARAFSAGLDGHWAGRGLLGSFLEPPPLGKLRGWRHFPSQGNWNYIYSTPL